MWRAEAKKVYNETPTIEKWRMINDGVFNIVFQMAYYSMNCR